MTFPEWFDSKFGPHTPELYREEVQRSSGQVKALRRILGEPDGAPVLDLCCGWGRHALPLAALGYPVVGLDGSAYFLELLRSEDKMTTGRLPVLRGDMRRLPFVRGSFRAVYQMYTSFGYGDDPSDDRRVLSEVNRVLSPGGLYLLDLINWSLARRAFDGVYEDSYPEFDVVEDCRILPGDLLRMKRALLFRDGRPVHEYTFEIRMYDCQTLCDLALSAGLELKDAWGDFRGTPYDPARSSRMILFFRRPEAA